MFKMYMYAYTWASLCAFMFYSCDTVKKKSNLKRKFKLG